MRAGFLFIGMALLLNGAWAQQPSAVPVPAQPAAAPTLFSEDLKSPATSPEEKLKRMFEEKIQSEWVAIKNQDGKAYGDLLADDYEGVEVDGKGERTKIQAVNELGASNIANYTLWGFRMIPSCPEANLAIYEVTMQFPPKSQVHFLRVYISELWVKRAGEWKILHSQETHVK
jgi:hypothetical protein